MFDRTIKLIGNDNYQKIKNSNILVLGIGGVGGYAIETLIRSGLENITIVDYDKIDITNVNRQIIAKNNNIGKSKTEEWKKRILSINKNVNIKTVNDKIDEENIYSLFDVKYDYIIDACDTITVKKLLIKECKNRNIKLITVCGMGGKLDPTLIKICDIRNTSYDPLAKSLRKYVKENNIKGKIICVSSEEKPIKTSDNIVPSMMIVPAVAGIYASNYVINDIITKENIK